MSEEQRTSLSDYMSKMPKEAGAFDRDVYEFTEYELHHLGCLAARAFEVRTKMEVMPALMVPKDFLAELNMTRFMGYNYDVIRGDRFGVVIPV